MRKVYVPDTGEVRPRAHDHSRNAARDAAVGFRDPVSGDRWRTLRPGVARVAGEFQAVGGAQPDPWSLLGGRERPSWTGSADGSPIWPHGCVKDHRGPRFDAPVAPGGYAWWYIDALSDDGRHGLTLIAFVGSVFSPYYALARRRLTTDAEQHCAVNVSLTGSGGHRWAMTERDRCSVARSAHELTIGPSRLTWNGQSLRAEINEVTAPIPRKLSGHVELHPAALTDVIVPLDRARAHHWSPIAPLARVKIRLDRPQLSWSGFAYFDSNFGTAPLEHAFRHWTWSRTIEAGRTRVLYDVMQTCGEATSLALEFDGSGTSRAIVAPPVVVLPHTRWRLPRVSRTDRGGAARIRATWEDGPFYARSLIETGLGGEQVTAVHESLSLERFRRPVVQAMLPFRMPRRSHAPRP